MSYDIREVIDRTSMISRADSRGASPNATYEITRFVRTPFRHLLKAVENNLTGTGSTLPMRGVIPTSGLLESKLAVGLRCPCDRLVKGLQL
jgi:hypothetical protein